MNKLKPCPFCGRKAELGHTEKDSEYGKTAFVYCTNCGANGKMIEISSKYGADEKAIEAWNRRVNEDAPTADVFERKRGKWVDDGKPVDPDRDSCWCSVCGAWLVGSDEYRVAHNFCPNCGADMREENNDEVH